MGLPLEYDVLLNGKHKKLGSTRLWGQLIVIVQTEHPEMENYDGLCIWFRGHMSICLARRVVTRPKRFKEVLWHELTHAIEYLNDPEFLSPVVFDGCSMLAQAMEYALPALRQNLKLRRGLRA